MRPLSSGDSSRYSAVEDAAIAWLAERDDGFVPSREREFAQWLRADPRHAAAVARLEQTLGLLGELPQFRAELNTEFDRLPPVVPIAPASGEQSPARARRWRNLLGWAGVAATLAVGITTGWRLLRPTDETRFSTVASGYARARLDDGSTLQLNSASVARVQFTTSERRVMLETGEAYFEVAHDLARPFVVQADGVAVRAVGTAFNVRLTGENMEVAVVEGKVRISRGRIHDSDTKSGAFVSAGERALVPRQPAAPAVEKIAPAVLRQAVAWQNRLVEFAGVPLAEVVLRFNARNRIQLVLADSEVGSRRIGGTFALDEPEGFARLLARDGEIVAERRGDAEILLRLAR